MTTAQASADPALRGGRLLEHKVAIVTGASRGIGAAAARAFAAAGATVVLAARSTRDLNEVAAQITVDGGGALAVPTDVGDPAAAERLVARTLEAFGHLDAAFNNAGEGHLPTPLADLAQPPAAAPPRQARRSRGHRCLALLRPGIVHYRGNDPHRRRQTRRLRGPVTRRPTRSRDRAAATPLNPRSHKETVMSEMLFLTPGDRGWDDARQAWNLAVNQHPAAVALPGCVQDVVSAVGFARAHGLRVAAQGTGHNAGPLGSLADTILIKTTAMRRVSIDPVAKTARAEAGAVWQDVVEAAAGHGLAALAGSSPGVGVVGYTIGGGISWLGRAYGLAANNVEAIEMVTADGRPVRADARTETDLFWALRGGGGSFGVVTAIELRLFPIAEVYAGQLWWPADAAAPVLQAWRELTQGDLPKEFTSAARLANFPQIPAIPEHLRGRSFVIIFVSHLGRPAQADALLAPLRALRPVTDTIATIPVTALGQLHMDPEQPTRSVSQGFMAASLSAEATETFIRAAGPGADTPPGWAELLRIGGELRRARPDSGALAAIDADYQLSAGSPAPSPQATPAAERSVAAVLTAMRPWAARQMYLNLAGTSLDPASFWTPEAYDRLRRIKAAVDPDDLIHSNHPVPPHQDAAKGLPVG